MVCTSILSKGIEPICRIYRGYASKPGYRGELCYYPPPGCPYWQMESDDRYFKNWIEALERGEEVW